MTRIVKVYEKTIEILRLEATAIESVAAKIGRHAVEKAVELLLNCAGKVIVTGVGKSGVIAQKIAQTMTSTGTPAVFVHPSDAMHGGLGILANGDVVLALSNSGETEELVAMLPAIARRDVAMIAIVGNADSTLAKSSDVVLEVSIDKEACPLDLAPTSSTTAALALGDAIAMTLMEAKGLTEADFAVNHPAGRLGRRLTVQVGDLMKENPAVSRDAGWMEVVKGISTYALGAVNVVDESGKLLGIVTDGDLRRTIERTAPNDLAALTAESMMTAGPITTSSDTLAFEALHVMEDRASQISVLPVVDGEKCVGLIRLHDIVRSGI
ncbi:MAG: KpsF/GutQ family sugar-phosphate isomerase [Acidobacteria bacterium ACB1]|nr:KpsF/GutQ family sugar-phosphate isomerase [Acidobacteria bacterium ACB1]RIJ91563.1 MAG: KpsF/GutQ family sugar-phosphate isomerase [Acidobacteriota bacterium]